MEPCRWLVTESTIQYWSAGRESSSQDLGQGVENAVALVRRGESIRVTYRSKAAFTLQPEKPTHTLLPGSAQAMKKFSEEARKLRDSNKQPYLDPSKSIKELYHDLLDTDPKHRPPYHR